MSKIIDMIATATAIGITGYFIYKVILPNLKDIQLPTWQFPQFPTPGQTPQLPSTPSTPTPSQPTEEQPSEEKKPKQTKQSSTPTTSQPTVAKGPVGKGLTPEALGMKSTGKKVALNVGGNPSGAGQRYNVNHAFTNYVMMGLFQNASSQQLIEMKTDGPNHSGCSQVPRCAWFEPRFEMSGKSSMSMEMPHTPRKDYDIACSSCKSIPGSYTGKWIGYAVAAYGPKGGRVVEQWVDPTGTGNNWQNTIKEKIDARFHQAQNRDLPIEGRGLEAEIRMHGAGNKGHGQSGGTNMKNGFVYEIVQPASSNLATIRKNMLDEPYLYNGYYNRRRL